MSSSCKQSRVLAAFPACGVQFAIPSATISDLFKISGIMNADSEPTTITRTLPDIVFLRDILADIVLLSVDKNIPLIDTSTPPTATAEDGFGDVVGDVLGPEGSMMSSRRS